MNGNKHVPNGEGSPQNRSEDSPPRAGRPRGFSDEEAFIATTRAVKANGYASLTMNAIAKELGCTAPALQGRFGSKAGLLQAFLRWGTEVSADQFARARQQHDSRIRALVERFRYPDDWVIDQHHEIGDLDNQINLLGFHVAAWSDPDLHECERERRTLFEEEIVALLTEALELGEIQGCDPRRLGQNILAAIVGTELQWVSNPEPVSGKRLGELIEELIQPYRVRNQSESTLE